MRSKKEFSQNHQKAEDSCDKKKRIFPRSEKQPEVDDIHRKEKPKKKPIKKEDGSWDLSDLYRNSDRYPFEIEWLKYFNPMEGRDQIVFLYKDKKTKKIIKHGILR